MAEYWSAFRLWLSCSIRMAGGMMAAQYALRIGQSVFASLQALGIATLIDAALAGRPVLPPIVLILASLVATLVVQVISGPLSLSVNERLQGHINRDLLTLTTGLPTIDYLGEPAVGSRVSQLTSETWRLSQGADVLVSLTATIVNLAVVIWLLSAVHPALVLLPLAGLMRTWSSAWAGRLTARAVSESAPANRRALLLLDLATNGDHALEVRTYGMADRLRGEMHESLAEASRIQREAGRRAAMLDGAVRCVFALLYAGVLGALVNGMFTGLVSQGDLALVILLAARIERATSGIADSGQRISELLQFFRDYDWLRRYAVTQAEHRRPALTATRIEHGISLEDVSFTYPGGGRAAVSGTSVLLPAGATVALVGENGAGKSTLVELLLRLRDPISGSLRLDGNDILAHDRRTWWPQVSAVLQDFCRYKFRAGETIGIGDLARAGDDAAVREAAALSGAQGVVDGLPHGLETQLGSQFADGADLSGGQWQRLALARSLMRRRPLLLVLDEPSSALDPLAEGALLDCLRGAARRMAAAGGITVIVSHRMSTVREADLIVVLSKGRIVESGDHQELVTRAGAYAELYSMQSRGYGSHSSP